MMQLLQTTVQRMIDILGFIEEIHRKDIEQNETHAEGRMRYVREQRQRGNVRPTQHRRQ